MSFIEIGRNSDPNAGLCLRRNHVENLSFSLPEIAYYGLLT